MDHLYFVVHTHWDREWYQPFQQMRARLVAMTDRMIPLVERGTIPFFHFDGMTIARRFGRPLDVGYLPDQFGHIAQMPQILAGFGFTTAVLWRGVGADVERNRFTWEGLDGSSVLT